MGHTKTLYNQDQIRLLNKAQEVGQALTGMPETIQSILLTESSAGAGGIIGDGGRSLGVMQVQARTAAYVARIYKWVPKHRDKKKYAQLLLQEDYGLLYGIAYYKKCRDTYKKDWRRSVVCYNVGEYGASKMSKYQIDNHPYLKKVKKHLKDVRKWRKNR